MDLTTVARVKAILEISGAQHDTVLGQLVTGVSAAIERFLNRRAKEQAYTEQYDVIPGQQRLFLRAYPVAAAPAAIFANDISRTFGGSAVIPATNYYLDLERGIVEFDRQPLVYGPGVVQAIYTGGMGTDENDFVINFPDVAQAAEAQIAYLWQRRGMKGVATLSSGGASISLETPTIELQPGVRAMIQRHRRAA